MMSRSYKEKFPDVGVALRDVPQLEVLIKDSYQYDTKTCMVSIPPTWHKRDLNVKHMHDDNKSILATYKKGSQSIK